MTNQSSGEEPKTASWQRSLRRFFIRPDVELCIAILILLSVALTLIELALEGSGVSADRPQLFYVMLFNQLLTSFFVIELTLRFFFGILKVEVLAGVLAGHSLGLTTLSSVSRLSNPAALAIVPCHASPRNCDTACQSLSGGFSSRHG